MEMWQTTLLGIIVGSVLPTVFSMVLPRLGTVKFGMALYKFMGVVFGQKRATRMGIPVGVWGNFFLRIRATLTDISFGIYIASREDLEDGVIQHKIKEYLEMPRDVK